MKKLVFIIFIFFCYNTSDAIQRKGRQMGADSSTVGGWHFNAGEGVIAYDFSGNNNYGELFGYPVWVDGIWENMLDFGADDHKVEIPHSSSLEVPDTANGKTLNLIVWVRPDVDFSPTEPVDEDWFTIIEKWTGGNGSWTFSYDTRDVIVGEDEWNGSFIFVVRGADGNYYRVIETMDLSAGEDYQIVITADDELMKMYINGELKDTQITGTHLLWVATDLKIGVRFDNTKGWEYGKIEEVLISDRSVVFTAAEIAYNYRVAYQ